MLGRHVTRSYRYITPVTNKYIVASNSLDVSYGDPLALNASGFAVKAGITGEIYGFAVVDQVDGKTFDSDNQTNAKETVSVQLANPLNTRLFANDNTSSEVTPGVLYKLTASGEVDVTAGAQTTDAQVEAVSSIESNGKFYTEARPLRDL